MPSLGIIVFGDYWPYNASQRRCSTTGCRRNPSEEVFDATMSSNIKLGAKGAEENPKENPPLYIRERLAYAAFPWLAKFLAGNFLINPFEGGLARKVSHYRRLG